MSFRDEVVEVIKGVKEDFAKKEFVKDDKPIDPQVREQINTDLDGLIKKHEIGKAWPL